MITEALRQSALKVSRSAYSLGLTDVPAGYELEQPFEISTTGFKAAVFLNRATNERIVAFTGTEQSFQDAYSDLHLGWTQWARSAADFWSEGAEDWSLAHGELQYLGLNP